jgi:diaminopimelate epimerase
VKNGLCTEGRDVIVKLAGGDLIVSCYDGRAVLTGGAEFVFEGSFEY